MTAQVRSTPADIKVWFAVREARGLTAAEKAFLWVVGSRGEMWTTVKRARADIGIGRTAFYSTRNRLIRKGLLVARERRSADGTSETTVYTVNLLAVEALADAPQHDEDKSSHPETDAPMPQQGAPPPLTRHGSLPSGERAPAAQRSPSVRPATGKEDPKNFMTNTGIRTSKDTPQDEQASLAALRASSASPTSRESRQTTSRALHAATAKPSADPRDDDRRRLAHIRELAAGDPEEFSFQIGIRLLRGQLAEELETSKRADGATVYTFGSLEAVTLDEIVEAVRRDPHSGLPLWRWLTRDRNPR